RNPLVFFQTLKKNWDADHRPLEWEDLKHKPDDLFRRRHLKAAVKEAVEQLPEHHRIVFVLRELEGKSYDEISEITGCNLGTVKSRLNRARNNFANLVAPLID
ncbi:MAG: sigma-70 family RNA polymerase sigma factor, partial [Gemmatimonadota bacterium]